MYSINCAVVFLRVKLGRKVNKGRRDQWGLRYEHFVHQLDKKLSNGFKELICICNIVVTGYSRAERRERQVWDHCSKGKRSTQNTGHHFFVLPSVGHFMYHHITMFK